MPVTDAVETAALRRYADLVEATVRAMDLRRFEPAGLVEWGVPYPILLLGLDRELTLPGILDNWLIVCTQRPLTPANVGDRQNHRRPAYRGLLFHAILRALRLAPARPETVDRCTALLAEQLATVHWPEHPADRIPAGAGAAITDAVWMALAAHDAAALGADSSWRTLASDAFGRLVGAQHPVGTFLTPGASDNPETHWYHELVILHAATFYATDARDEALAAAVARNAEFHLAETQPDHATNQPWGLAAFARHPSTRPLADQMLHAAATIGGASGVTSILLADALYSLRLWTSSPT